MITKYIHESKLYSIDAVQLTISNIVDVAEWVMSSIERKVDIDGNQFTISIPPNISLVGFVGDYIAKYPSGIVYVIKEDILNSEFDVKLTLAKSY